MPDKRDAFRARNSALRFVSLDEAQEQHDYEDYRQESKEQTTVEQCVLAGMYRGMR